ncbi:MAG: FG-GAP repeat protein [Planctomycetota bacterium]
MAQRLLTPRTSLQLVLSLTIVGSPAFAQTFPGTGEGVQLLTGVGSSVPDASDLKVGFGGVELTARVASTDSSLDGALVTLGIGVLPTGQLPLAVVPGIAIDLSAPFVDFALGNLAAGEVPAFAGTVPQGLVGSSLFLQGFALPIADPGLVANGLFASTDAHQVDIQSAPATPVITESIRLVSNDIAANDGFGTAVSIDGALGLVGAPREDASGFDSGSAYLFDLTTGQQVQKVFLGSSANTDNFASSLVLNDGRAVIGAWRNSEAATLAGTFYGVDPFTSTELAMVTPIETVQASLVGQSLGFSTAFSDTFVVSGARGDVALANGGGSTYIYDASTLSLLHKVFPSDPGTAANFGHEVSTSGDLVAVSAPFNSNQTTEGGAIYVFDGLTGLELHRFAPDSLAPFDLFGERVAIEGELVMGASGFMNIDLTNDGAAFAFDVATGEQLAQFTSPAPEENGRFGAGLAISSDYIAIAETLGTNSAGVRTGVIYVYDRATFELLATLEASDGLEGDALGEDLSISGNQLIAGAAGVDADGDLSGAAYVFELP